MVNAWTSEQFVRALRHDGKHDVEFNPNHRQLLHLGFKVAAEMGVRFTTALEANGGVIARNVTENLFERRIKPIVLG